MRHLMKRLLLVAAIAMCFAAAQPALAEDTLPTIAGVVDEALRDLGIIKVIDQETGIIETIKGFPFSWLEKQLKNPMGIPNGEELAIEECDFVEIEYIEEQKGNDPDNWIKKAVALLQYCDREKNEVNGECGIIDIACYDGDGIDIMEDDDGEYYPVNKYPDPDEYPGTGSHHRVHGGG